MITYKKVVSNKGYTHIDYTHFKPMVQSMDCSITGIV